MAAFDKIKSCILQIIHVVLYFEEVINAIFLLKN